MRHAREEGLKVVRVLMLSPTLPCAARSARAFSLLKALSASHKVVLMCMASKGENGGERSELDGLCERIEMIPRSWPVSLARCMRGFSTGSPLNVLWFDSDAFRRRVREIVENEEIDAAVAVSSKMAPYLSDVQGIPAVLDIADCTSMLLDRARESGDMRGRFLAAVEGRRQELFEAGVWRAAHVCTVSAESQRRRLQRLSGYNFPSLRVLPSAVDLEGLTPSAHEMALKGRVLLVGDSRQIASRDAVRFFCGDIWPRVAERCPRAHLVVTDRAGAGRPAREARGHRITVLAPAPDIRSEILKAEVVVYPMRVGPGSRDEVLKSLAMRRPVVSTSLGADGLDVEHGKHVLIADRAEKFADAVRTLLEDSELADRLADEGSSLVRLRHSIEKMEMRLDGILSSLCPCLQEICRL